MTLPGSEIMLNCQQVSRLLSERQERRLTLHERAGLQLHLMMCGECRRFSRQIDWIQRILGRARDAEQCPVDQAMPDAARERIRHALQERLKQDDSAG